MQIDLQNIRNIKDLSKYLNISVKDLSLVRSEEHKERIIKLIQIYKYSNKYREVAEVLNMTYKNILKNIANYLNQIYSPISSVYGFIKKMNIIKNATQHLNKKIILKCDIKDFFYTININSVKEVFRNLGANNNVSDILSQITTFRDVLFPGLNTSPVLSNIYCTKLDNDLINVSKEFNCTYTRYADDIAISGDFEIPTREKIEKILGSYGFKINNRKYKVMRRGHYQVITGLSVADKRIPRIPRDIKKRIRLVCFLLSKYKELKEFDKNVPWFKYRYLKDVLIFYLGIEPVFVNKMLKLANGNLKISNE